MRSSTILAGSILAASMALMTFSLWSLTLPGTEFAPDRPNPIDVIVFGAIFVWFPTVGFVLARLRPANSIGWLLLAIGLSLTASIFASEYVVAARYGAIDLPAAPVVAWLGWLWFLGPGIAVPLLILLFPDERLPSPRWRPFVTAGIVLSIAVAVMIAFTPGWVDEDEGIRNPFGVLTPLAPLSPVYEDLTAILLLAMMALATAGLVKKFRASRGSARQQFKWLLYPAALFLGGFVVAGILGEDGAFAWTFSLLGLAGIPMGIGIAILRYRLYDIDVVIRRTLVYGVVIAILGVAYVGLVLALQSVLADLTGGETLPVAVSTLVIAALFGPVRSRVRELVDRRFYRARYDAQRTLEAFAGRLRDEVELDAVGGALANVAGNAVRPASVGVWIRSR